MYYIKHRDYNYQYYLKGFINMRKLLRTSAAFFLSASFAFSGIISASAYEVPEFDIRTEAPSDDESAPEYIYYFSKENPYNTFGGCEMPNCTAYAWGRAYEAFGVKPELSWNNAGKWYRENTSYSYGSEPRPGAVICYDYGDENSGHVAFVEKVSDDGSRVTLSESQYRGEMFATYEQASDYANKVRGLRLLGYIYTGDTEKKFYGDAFKLVSYENEQYLTVSESSIFTDQKLSDTVSQNYRFEPLENGNYRIWSYGTDLALTRNENGDVSPENNETADSEWKLLTEINNQYTICSPEDTNRVLTVSEEGAYISEYTASKNQFWIPERVTGRNSLESEERNIVFSLDCTETRKEYYTDEYLDLSGIRFFLNGNMIENIDTSKLSAFYDFTAPGTVTVTVSYGYSSISYDVTVTEPEEGEEVIRNNELHTSIVDFIIYSENSESTELDITSDGRIAAANVLLNIN